MKELTRNQAQTAAMPATTLRNKSIFQRAAVNSAPVNQAPPIVHDVLHSPGQQLDPVTRDLMESRFEQDFSGVRIHTDSQANESAQAIQAQAYAIGRDIVFGNGHYAPNTAHGQWLLAHELAHTVQQRGVGASVQQFSIDGSATEDLRLEREADHAADEAVVGRFASIVGSVTGASLQRQGNNKQGQSQTQKIVPPVEPGKAQKKMIDEARRAAAIRTQTAMFKASGVQGAQQFQEARRLAQIKFDWADPNMDQISEVLSGMGGGLVTVDVKVAGAGDPECGTRAGYVRDHRPPIILCPGFFTDPTGNEGRTRTMIHEMAHVKGIGKADVGAEQYFPVFDCMTKGAFESADSWSNYVHCLSGGTPDKPEEIVGGSKTGKQTTKKPGGS